MNKSKKLICIITGKSIVFSGDYLDSKIAEYENEANLEKMYVCKEVKAFLKKGYKITDIRKILNVPEDEDMPPKEVINKLESEYQKTAIKVNETAITQNVLTNFTHNKSDADVENFMNTFIIKTK